MKGKCKAVRTSCGDCGVNERARSEKGSQAALYFPVQGLDYLHTKLNEAKRQVEEAPNARARVEAETWVAHYQAEIEVES